MKKFLFLLLVAGFGYTTSYAQSDKLSRTNKKTYPQDSVSTTTRDRGIQKMDKHPAQDNSQMRPTSDVDRNNKIDPNNPASPANPTNPNVPANTSNNPNTTAPNNQGNTPRR